MFLSHRLALSDVLTSLKKTSVFNFISTDTSGGIPCNYATKGEFLPCSMHLFDLHMQTLSRYTTFKISRSFI